MRTLLLLALLTSAVLVAGCEDSRQASAYGGPAKNSAITSASTPAPRNTEAPTPPPPMVQRNSTTQQLPAGWSYVTEKELAAGPAVARYHQASPAN